MAARPFVLLLVCLMTLKIGNAATPDQSERARTVALDVGDLVLGAKLYAGKGEDARPAVILLHGWTWPWDDPSRALVSAALEFQQAGYTVLVPSLRGWPPTGGEDDCAGKQIDDVLHALVWLGQQDRIDPNNLFLAGYSQGGQVALLTAGQDAPVRAVAAFAPVIDPGSWGEDTNIDGIRDYVMQECGGPQGWKARSVLNHVDSLRVPVLLVHGDGDKRVPTNQSVRLHQRLIERRHPVQMHLLSGVDHDQRDVLRPQMAIEYFNRLIGQN